MLPMLMYKMRLFSVIARSIQIFTGSCICATALADSICFSRNPSATTGVVAVETLGEKSIDLNESDTGLDGIDLALGINNCFGAKHGPTKYTEL